MAKKINSKNKDPKEDKSKKNIDDNVDELEDEDVIDDDESDEDDVDKDDVDDVDDSDTDEDDEESDEDDEESDEDDEGEDDEEDDEDEDVKSQVPLKTFLKERSKSRALNKRLRKLEEAHEELETRENAFKFANKYEGLGLDPELSSAIAADIAKAQNRGVKESKFEEGIIDELTDLAEDDLYDDALDHKIQIIKKIRAFKKKGVEMSVEDVYLSVVGASKLKQKALHLDVKRKAAKRIENKKTGTTKSDRTSSDTKINKGNYGLDNIDLKALRELKKAQPNANWSAKKYAKVMKPK